MNIEWQSRKALIKRIDSLEASIKLYWQNTQNAIDALEDKVETLQGFTLQETTLDNIILEDITEELPLINTSTI
jgi:hypothetical protein